MAESRKILIITDGSSPVQKLAEDIAAIIGEVPGYAATVVNAEQFSGDNLLPVKTFFLGCGEPKPLSFLYIEALLKHINLAGRSCGIFSSNAKAIKYLSSLVRDSETAVGKIILAKNAAADNKKLHKWIQDILKKGEKNGLIQS